MDPLSKAFGGCRVEAVGASRGGGAINDGAAFVLVREDGGEKRREKIYVKSNSTSQKREMYEGEFASLKAFEEENVLRVPKPLKVVDGVGLVTEFIAMKPLRNGAELGSKLAALHSASSSSRFGFDVATFCGDFRQSNYWRESWSDFYADMLKAQLAGLGSDEANALWDGRLEVKVAELIDTDPKASLLHGDLWSGNAARAEDTGEAVVFDPGSFYGHDEFDLAIASMFGMPNGFFEAYHEKIPKGRGFQRRQRLYQLYHYLNHWRIFGSGYKAQSISIMKSLIDE